MISMDEESIAVSSSLDDNDLISINTKAKCNPVIVASNNNSSYKMDDNSSCNLLNSNHNKMSVQYATVSTNTPTISCKTDLQLGNSKMDHCESEKRSFVSLPIDNLNDLDASSLKAQSSVMNNNQRVLISPTDFLTLSEEASSAVKKDVNLSTSRLEIIKMFNDNNLTISLDRYCESPFLLEAHRETHLGDDDDDPSNNGRVSRLSESHDEMTPDDLFASTLTDQHNSLREVVITPLESESSGTASLARDCIKNINGVDIVNIKEEKFETEEIIEETVGPDDNESKPNLTLLNPLEQQMLPISPENLNSDSNLEMKNSFTSEATTSNQIQNGSVTVALPVTPLDIKILSPGLLQLAANLAAVFPSSTIQKQIALQLLREDGTSIIVPIATKSQEPINNNTKLTLSNETRDKTVTDTTTVTVSTDGVANPEADRPFKCELCNSTFTRLGNYTRHKKIHSLSSKEDQRFKCDICGKSFIQRCDLARHLHIHRGTEPHRCSQCGKGYIRHSDLVTHQRFHNKEKPFACPHCSKGFCQRGDLNRHLRSIHLQLKPILCSHCHKKFAKEETLLRHINANHRDAVVN